MKEIVEVTEIQDIAYRLLVLFHDFCEENELRYILAGGTLLGAVRHHDYIPWDDDVDVQMPREDYERFLVLAKDGIGQDTALICKNNIECPYITFAKIIDSRTVLYEDICIPNTEGIFIDVFPTDGLPDDDDAINKKFHKLQFLKKLLKLRTLKIKKGKSIRGWLLKLMLIPLVRVFFKPEVLINKIDSIARKDSFDACNRVAFQVLGYGIREVTDKNKYLNRVKIQFRDKFFYAPSNYDSYLTNLYGDYMQLPPEKSRIPHHGFKAYWLDN